MTDQSYPDVMWKLSAGLTTGAVTIGGILVAVGEIGFREYAIWPVLGVLITAAWLFENSGLGRVA